MAQNLASPSSIFILFLLLTFTSLCLACDKQDKLALLAIKNSFPPNSFPPSWASSSNVDCCSWDYIRCSPHTGRVRYLSISDNENITGPIPWTVGLLPNLQVLEFVNLPNLNGSIPPHISKLTQLHRLYFGNLPKLAGPVPPQLSTLTNLINFSIFNTSVSGAIPSLLSELTSLIVVSFTNNKFSSIPTSLDLGNVTNLRVLDLSSNQLSETIPPLFIGHSNTYTVSLILANNQLTGDIPASFDNILFKLVDLSNNKLTGHSAGVLFGRSKPTSDISIDNNRMAFNLSKVKFPRELRSLNISRNKIYGSIPEQITELAHLGALDVSYNKLCGEIPSGKNFREFSAEIYKHNKCLCGTPLLPCK